MAETKKRTQKRGTSVCFNCVNDFNNADLLRVRILDSILTFTTYMCKSCSEKYQKNNNSDGFEIVGPLKVVKPRAKKTTTTNKTTTKRKYVRKTKK